MRMRGAALPHIALLVVGGAVAEAQAQPTIDGIDSSGEWKDTQHHRLESSYAKVDTHWLGGSSFEGGWRKVAE